MAKDRVDSVIVVDDETVVRAGVSRILARLGIQADEACDGRAAIEMMEKKAYDVAFLDIRMPGMGGMEVLGWVTRHAPNTLSVMITGISEPNMVIQSMKMGAFDYLVKPFGVDDIEHIMERAAEGSPGRNAWHSSAAAKRPERFKRAPGRSSSGPDRPRNRAPLRRVVRSRDGPYTSARTESGVPRPKGSLPSSATSTETPSASSRASSRSCVTPTAGASAAGRSCRRSLPAT